MGSNDKERLDDALHRKLRRVVALLEDPAATEHERGNAEILKKRLEILFRKRGTPRGDKSRRLRSPQLPLTELENGSSKTPFEPRASFSICVMSPVMLILKPFPSLWTSTHSTRPRRISSRAALGHQAGSPRFLKQL